MEDARRELKLALQDISWIKQTPDYKEQSNYLKNTLASIEYHIENVIAKHEIVSVRTLNCGKDYTKYEEIILATVDTEEEAVRFCKEQRENVQSDYEVGFEPYFAFIRRVL